MVYLNLDINTMSRKELLKIPEFNSNIVDEIIYKREQKLFESLEKLLEIPNIYEKMIQKIDEYGYFTAVDFPESEEEQTYRQEIGEEMEEEPNQEEDEGETEDEEDIPTVVPEELEKYAYCLIVWILKGRRVGGSVVGSSPLAQGSTGDGAIQKPSQSAINDIANQVREANRILAQCNFQLRLCHIYVLDTHQVRTHDNQRRLSEQLFNEEGIIYSEKNSYFPIRELYRALRVHHSDKFDPRCAHIFFAEDVQKSPEEPDTNQRSRVGIGVSMHPGGRTRRAVWTPTGIVETGGSTIAHEVGHGMKLKHVEEEDGYDAEQDKNNLMKGNPPHGTDLNDSQCTRIREFAKTNMRKECP